MRNKEKAPEPSGKGYALVSRIHYDETRKRITRVDDHRLTPGDGVVFCSRNGTPLDGIRFQQEKIAETFDQLPPDYTFECFSLVDRQSGSLLVSSGETSNFGIDARIPFAGRVIGAEQPRYDLVAIWGETKEEAQAHLAYLQEQRARRN